uniref:Uncharacterized protein n=1 Tax=Globodera rostochiensis TaxID=31243 RepID=A0A914GXK2_GLORO
MYPQFTTLNSKTPLINAHFSAHTSVPVHFSAGTLQCRYTSVPAHFSAEHFSAGTLQCRYTSVPVHFSAGTLQCRTLQCPQLSLRPKQKVTDVALAKFEAGQDPPKRKKEDRLAGERILRLVQTYIPFDNAINHAPDHEYANLQNIDPYFNIITFLTGISRNYLMDA